MSSIVGGQNTSIPKLLVPSGVNIANNSGSSLTPIVGSIAQDVTTPGNLYVGDGSAWKQLQTTTGGNVVGPSSSFDGTIATFSGTTGKILQDNYLKISGAQALITLTGTNAPDMDNCFLEVMDVVMATLTGTVTIKTFSLGLGGNITTTGNPSSWTAPAGTIPTGFSPAFSSYFPGTIGIGNIPTTYENNVTLVLNNDGSFEIINPNAAGDYTLINLGGTYF